MENRVFNAFTGGLSYEPAERRLAATTKHNAEELAKLDVTFVGLVFDMEMSLLTRKALIRQANDAADTLQVLGVSPIDWSLKR